jgi:putative ABC transport system permease protein
MRLLHRLKYVLFRHRIDRELAEEIESHRLMTEHRLRDAGVPPTDAAHQSRRIMGNTTLAREDVRAMWITPWIDSVRQDVGYAFRVLRRAPAFAATMIAVMGLGIGATTGIFGLVDGIVLKSLPVREPHRLVYFSQPSFSYPVLMEVRARSAEVLSSVAGWNLEGVYVAWNTELEPGEVLMASGNFYPTLGIGAAIGRTFDEDDDRIGGGRGGLVAVISDAAWERRFNRDPSVIGRTIRVDRHVFTIVGVTPRGFFGVAPGLAPEITIPLTSTANPSWLTSTTSSSIHMLGRLRDGIGLERSNAALRTFWPAVLEATINPGMPQARRAAYLGRATTIEPGHAGYSRVRNQFGEPLWILLALVTLLLSIACASAANLLLARGVARQREIAVRLAIGASRRRLIRQMLTESLVWTIMASVAGLILALWGGRSLVALMTTSQEQIVVDLTLNWRILACSAGLAFATAVVCSLVPALGATRLDPGESLKETGQIPAPRFWRWSLGQSLVAAQVALTVVLLFGASLFVRSLARVLGEDAGVDRRGVLVLATDAEAVGYEDDRLIVFYDQLRERLAALPGVQSVSLSMYPPISDEDGAWTQNIGVDGNPVPDAPGAATVYFNAISPGFFQTTGMGLVGGRDFGRGETATSPRVAVVNETLARRFFPGQQALGRTITMGRNQNRQDVQIVGIVRDAKYQRLSEEARSIAYLPYKQQRTENLFAEIRMAGAPAAIADRVRREVRALDPVVPIRLETVADRIRESLVTERVITLLATALGITALILACAGLYGMLAYAVSRRTREMGVRLALGATRSELVGMVLAHSMALSLVGVIAGAIAALAVAGFTATLLYRMSPRDPVSLAAAVAIMLALASLAALIPARRAARVDPVQALRCE